MQAALCLLHRGRGIVADFHFRHPGAAFERQHGNRLAGQIEQVQRHAVTFEDFDFDDRLGMLLAAQEFVDANRCALAVGHAVNDQARPEHAVAAGEDAIG